MAYATSITVEDGSTNIIQVPFPYLVEQHVHVYVNAVEVDQTTLIWTSPGTVKLPVTAASLAGAVVLVQRVTTALLPDVVYKPGGLDYNDLNDSILQLLYFSQEQADAASQAATSGLPAPTPTEVYLSQIEQGLADPTSIGYDPTFKVMANIPPDIPYNPVAMGFKSRVVRVRDAAWFWIQANLGLSAANMGTFFTQCLEYPITPETETPVASAADISLAVRWTQIMQGLADNDPLNTGYDPTYSVLGNVPPLVPYNPVAVCVRADFCRPGDSGYQFIQQRLGLNPLEMGAFFLRCLAYPLTP